MGSRGPTPALIDNAVLREWWQQGEWAKLAPVLEQLAHGVAMRARLTDDEAADVAQVTLIRCWQAPAIPDHPAAFVGRVARNLALDRIKRGSAKYETTDERAEAETPEPNQLDQIVLDAARQQLKLALRLVPEHLRRPLVLHVFHGKNMQQLAVQFGSTEGAMKMRMVRARAALRAIYEAEAPALALSDLKLTVHAKRMGTVEVRAFIPMTAHDHRIGTWCLPEWAWRKIREPIERGFAVAGLALHIDDTHAARHGAANPLATLPTLP